MFYFLGNERDFIMNYIVKAHAARGNVDIRMLRLK